ncbi:MAG: DUF2333 family protein [Gammaproteobacteria bacterium]|nr:DUF2333 family protein [Gammaproteobacteria bacterium]NNJ71975.1 DUF2333 family protein [Enterobacterales bacterium]
MKEERNWLKPSLWSLAGLIFLGYLIAVYWSFEPAPRSFENTQSNSNYVKGQELVGSLIYVVDTLLEKPGGFLGNDVMPPSVLMDNMPAFEYGAIIQARDLTRSIRKEFSRSQSQSLEQEDMKLAEPKIHMGHTKWMLPSAEGQYSDSVEAMQAYLNKLSNPSQTDAQFYARADNLREWLGDVSNRLGSYSQRLSASVGQDRVNTDLAGDSSATQSTATQSSVIVKTDWFKIDDEFYEARGACWALIQFLKAVEIDFQDVLEKKNANASLQQIIRELEATQDTVWSPMILNGGGFGFVANHSLVMASYISRANAALIDLRELLSQG